TFADPFQYQYPVGGFIFGAPNPMGTLHTPAVEGDQTSTGPLEVAYTANPTDNSSGGWWKGLDSYKTAPDVALNHPNRWRIESSGPADSCRGGSNSVALSCAVFNEPPDLEDPANCPDLACLWTSGFYEMRGLFITSTAANEMGPQMEIATE